MRFRSDWRAPAVWMSLSLFNVVLALLHFHKHGWSGTYAWIQLFSWTSILVVWCLILNQSWHFENDRLVMKRFPLPNVTIPYENITSVDWTSQRNISLTLGGSTIFRSMEKRTVMVRDMPGFLSQMELHIAPGILHV